MAGSPLFLGDLRNVTNCDIDHHTEALLQGWFGIDPRDPLYF